MMRQMRMKTRRYGRRSRGGARFEVRYALLSVVFLGLLAGLMPETAHAEGAVRTCAVAEREGAAARIWAGGAWRDAAAGAAVPAEAKVATGPESRVRIACSDGTEVTVGAETEVNLDALAGLNPARDGVVLQLIDGIVGLFAPAAPARSFEVRTPLAVASVRSTRWLVAHGSAEGAEVFVREGRVAVRTSAGAPVLGPGEGIAVDAGGAVGAVATWSQPRIDRSMARLGLGWR